MKLTYALLNLSLQAFLKDASTFKQQQLLDAELIKQGIPNARQARLVSF